MMSKSCSYNFTRCLGLQTLFKYFVSCSICIRLFVFEAITVSPLWCLDLARAWCFGALYIQITIWRIWTFKVNLRAKWINEKKTNLFSKKTPSTFVVLHSKKTDFTGLLYFLRYQNSTQQWGIQALPPRNHSVFEAMVSLPTSMASSFLSLPRSCHDLGKDVMAMQDRAKANHDLGKDAKIYHALDKASMYHDLPWSWQGYHGQPWINKINHDHGKRSLASNTEQCPINNTQRLEKLRTLRKL